MKLDALYSELTLKTNAKLVLVVLDGLGDIATKERLITLGSHEEAMGQVWHLPCAPTLTQRELLTLIFQAAGKPPKLGEAPGAVFKILGLFIPVMRELAELLYQWERPLQAYSHCSCW